MGLELVYGLNPVQYSIATVVCPDIGHGAWCECVNVTRCGDMPGGCAATRWAGSRHARWWYDATSACLEVVVVVGIWACGVARVYWGAYKAGRLCGVVW